VEIERKFLVDAIPGDLGDRRSSAIEQGYVAIGADGTEVRIRRRDGASTLTVKSGGGLARVEEELAIDDAAFERLWPLTEGRRIEKVRHVVPTDVPGVVIELDEYGGDLDGLLVAEVEFPGEDEARAFTPPPWFGADVTDDRRFKNQRLAIDGRPAG
jgi:adenylate cyclase